MKEKEVKTRDPHTLQEASMEEEPVISLKKTVEALERRLILEALERTGWIQARAARCLDISQRVLSYKMKKYRIPSRKPRS